VAGWTKLAIIAGAGDLPVRLAEHCRASDKPYFVSRITGVSDAALATHPGADTPMDKMGARLKGMHDAGCDAIVLAGNVRRPDFSKFAPDLQTIAMLPRILAAAGKGDDALLRAIIVEYERDGFVVVGAEEVLADLLATAGAMGAYAPDDAAMKDIERAAAIAGALGVWDVGQGAVVCSRLALAVEAQEGTDAMLARVAALPEAVRGTPDKRRGVLVKRTKPAQERRVDLPTIGLATIEAAARAGLAGIAVETGGALVLDKPAMIARADALSMFVYGFDPAAP
jgi:DUF1009 family protein